MKIDINTLDETQLCALVDSRWSSSAQLWDVIERVYKQNTAVYGNEAAWLGNLPQRRQSYRVQANRVFVNMEAVINSLIANPPGLNVLPSRETEASKEFARQLERYFRKKFEDLNTKETLRMGLRNLYFARLLMIKAFWNPHINDFDFRSLDPRKVRVGKYAKKEQESEFVIEEIEDNLCSVIQRFPAKKDVLMKKYGMTDDQQLYIKNPDVKYKESWINEYVIFTLDNIVLDRIKNPYWDWDGILITDEEATQLNELEGNARRDYIQNIKTEQEVRKAQKVAGSLAQDGTTDHKAYYFNYFDTPRKPYIFATIFNNENSPIGRTDMITLSSELQRGIDKRKMDIDENCEFLNGILKVDSEVMSKQDASRIRFETKGVIWGKGVNTGVTRETGAPLPQMVFEDMTDSRQEIDNIMAATSAFRGERQGQETKAGRLALIQQSYLRLNELVQVVDFVSKEIFSWGMQLAKTRYTEYHYTKWMGKDEAHQVMELIQDDFVDGQELTIMAGKTLPVDDEFKFEQAQNDVKNGYISPIDYLRIANYDDAKGMAKSAFMYKISPFSQFEITDEERQKIPPPLPQSSLREQIAFDDLPAAAKVQWLARMGITVTEDQITQEGVEVPVSIAYDKLPPDGQIQAAAKAGILLDPHLLLAEKAKTEALANKPNLKTK